jgi:signal transduction histidine kinase
MADVLHDPSLMIAYRRPTLGTYVDHTGSAVQMPPAGPARAVADIERDGQPVASVLYDGGLADQEPFVHAAGAAAAMRLQEFQLEADLKASLGDLARSRRRLVEAADAERQRIERDLHDGAQQHIVGVRVKLELAREAIRHDAARGERMLEEIGDELDDALDELRSLAQGVYPPLLAEHGLAEALKSTARRAPIAISVSVPRLSRYPADIETAVYFCCREALQNVAKHGGGSARLGLSEQGAQLHFAVADSGPGFDPESRSLGQGIVNMCDRIEAVGGTLTVTSHAGGGTVISGVVPLRSSET